MVLRSHLSTPYPLNPGRFDSSYPSGRVTRSRLRGEWVKGVRDEGSSCRPVSGDSDGGRDKVLNCIFEDSDGTLVRFDQFPAKSP